MAQKLNQVIAAMAEKKKQADEVVTTTYQQVQKADLFKGISRDYRPVDEDGEKMPPERKNVQFHVKSSLDRVRKAWTTLFDAVATQDTANCKAVADIVVDGVSVAKSVPVTHLLFLEKKLVDVRTFLAHLPELPAEKEWKWSDNTGCFVTEEELTLKTKKVVKSIVLYPATEQHPAQVQAYNEDLPAGWWHTVHQSGAMPKQEKDILLERVNKVIAAIKCAREEANMLTVSDVKVAAPLFDFVFNGNLPSAPAA